MQTQYDGYGNPTLQTDARGVQMPAEGLVHRHRRQRRSDRHQAAFAFRGGRPSDITISHNNLSSSVAGNTWHDKPALYIAHGPKASLKLQDHGNPVRYRNIWIRPL
ncbi:MAG TPA: hypothetical protein VJ464_05945 [Blastocatellia bacterium]|nr:hypothetical protein [Blastocatellia bacterium]